MTTTTYGEASGRASDDVRLAERRRTPARPGLSRLAAPSVRGATAVGRDRS